PGHDVAGVREDHGVVGGAVRLDGDGFADETERLPRGAVDLCRTTHRVRVLHLPTVLVGLVDAAAAHQRLDVRGRRPLTGEGTRIVDAGLEGVDRPEQGVDRHRGRNVRGEGQ